jgi:hypothetical protein
VEGELTLSFLIDSSGRVTRSEVRRATLSVAGLNGCLLELVDGLAFGSRKSSQITAASYRLGFILEAE